MADKDSSFMPAHHLDDDDTPMTPKQAFLLSGFVTACVLAVFVILLGSSYKELAETKSHLAVCEQANAE